MMMLALAVVLSVVLMQLSAIQYPSRLVQDGELSKVLHNAQSLLASRIMNNKRVGDVRCAFFGSMLQNLFFPVTDGSTAELNNVTLTTTSDLNLESVKPNLDEMNMEVSVSFSSLTIKGDFKLSSSNILPSMPLTISGQFSLNLTDMKASGKVGLKLEGDTLSTTNYDVNFQPANKSLAMSNNPKDDETPPSTTNTIQFEGTLMKKIQEEVKNLLNAYLKNELDRILGDESIKKLIKDKKMVDNYKFHIQEQSSNVNNMVDNLLNHVRDFFTKNNMQEISIPSFNLSFSKEILFVTWYGELSASDGFLNDLSTIQRTGDVTYSFEGDSSLVIVCSFMIGKLKMGYRHYVAKFMSVGPTGNIDVDVGSHSLCLKITVNLKDGISVKANEVRVAYVHDVEIHITGLGLLNWLTSKIATWIVALFKGEIGDTVSSLIKTAIESYSDSGISNILNNNSTR